MIAKCGCYVKSYRAKQCPRCGDWFCPACHSEHIASPETHCLSIAAMSIDATFTIRNQERTPSLVALEKRLAKGHQLPEKYRKDVPPLPE